MNEKKNLPSHRIFAVRNYEKNGEEKASWMEIGVAFQNKLGFSIQLQATPIDGRCVALPYEEKPYEQRGDVKPGEPKAGESGTGEVSASEPKPTGRKRDDKASGKSAA